MKKILLLVLTVGLGVCAMAQQPSVQKQGKIKGDTKVTFSAASAPIKQEKSERIHVSSYELRTGQDNVIKFSVDKIQDKQLIVKVVSEELCGFRKGDNFGEYIFTPKADKGTVVVRVGYMDVLGAYQNIGNVELYIGSRERSAQGAARPEGKAERGENQPQR